MTKGEKGMVETLKRVMKEFLSKQVFSKASVVNVANEEKRKVVSVSTSMKDEHVSLSKPKSQLTQLHDDDEDVFCNKIN